jgi:hypothetical protein
VTPDELLAYAVGFFVGACAGLCWNTRWADGPAAEES